MLIVRTLYARRVSVGSITSPSTFYHEGLSYTWGRCHGMGAYARVIGECIATGHIKEFQLDEMVDFYELWAGDKVVV